MYGLLVGAAYSLWHALPLIRASRRWPEILRDAEEALGTLVDEEPFDERLVKEWTGGYYLNSARYRVKRVIEKAKDHARFSDLLAAPPVVAFASVGKAGGVDETDPYAVWECLHATLLAFLDRFRTIYPEGSQSGNA